MDLEKYREGEAGRLFCPGRLFGPDKREAFCPGWCLQPGQKVRAVFVPVGATNRDKMPLFCLGWCLQPGQKALSPRWPG